MLANAEFGEDSDDDGPKTWKQRLIIGVSNKWKALFDIFMLTKLIIRDNFIF